MLRRVAALLMVLLFAGQSLAGGIVCGIDVISHGLSRSDEAASSMQSMAGCDEMACCAQGQSPTGSVVAMVCCEVVCGEPTGGALFDFAPLTLAPLPPVAAVRLVSLDALGAVEAAGTLASARSVDNSFLHHSPPDLFLSNSTFLI
jgi:hypothetical protein